MTETPHTEMSKTTITELTTAVTDLEVLSVTVEFVTVSVTVTRVLAGRVVTTTGDSVPAKLTFPLQPLPLQQQKNLSDSYWLAIQTPVEQ